MIEFKIAKEQHIESIMKIINDAKSFLKSQNIDQWQDGYPDLPCITSDVNTQKGYIITDDTEVIGYLFIDFDGEPAYNELIGGEWLTDNHYGVIHRWAISSNYRGSGIAKNTFEFMEKLCAKNSAGSIRIDTDQGNKRMHHILKKYGFVYCGGIRFDNSDKMAFEKVL